MNRQRVESGTIWEDQVGYCRAIKAGPAIFVSGTTAVDADGNVVGEGDVYQQCIFIFQKIEAALRELQVSMEEVVRTRTFITDISEFQNFARAHSEVFDAIRPAASCVEISRTVDPRLLVEIEVDAYVNDGPR